MPKQYGLQNAFYIAGIPGLISAALIWFMLDEPAPVERVAGPASGSFSSWWRSVREVMKVRNI